MSNSRQSKASHFLYNSAQYYGIIVKLGSEGQFEPDNFQPANKSNRDRYESALRRVSASTN